MKRMSRSALALAALFTPMLAVSGLYAQCRAGDPTGKFTGSAASTMAGDLKVTLNLLCQNGAYVGYLDSEAGHYTVLGGSFAGQVLKLQMARGDDTIDLELKGAAIDFEGSFTSANDGGPVKLHRVGDAAAMPAKRPAPAQN